MTSKDIEILIIADDPVETELIIGGLAKQQLSDKLLHIDNRAEALEFISSAGRRYKHIADYHLKLILLVTNLSNTSGVELLRQLKTGVHTRSIPVVIFTSSKEDYHIIEGYQLGVNSYIIKPAGVEPFDRAIRSLCVYWLSLNQCPFHGGERHYNR
ncbi:MAG TPA: response regulator [Chitinophagaceae bacterium]